MVRTMIGRCVTLEFGRSACKLIFGDSRLVPVQTCSQFKSYPFRVLMVMLYCIRHHNSLRSSKLRMARLCYIIQYRYYHDRTILSDRVLVMTTFCFLSRLPMGL